MVYVQDDMITSFVRRVKAKIHRAWYGPKRYRYLFDTIRQQRSRKIMEIGTWNGRRSVEMITLAQQFHAPSEVEYYGFDLFEQMTPEIYDEELSKKPPTLSEVKTLLEATNARIQLFQGFTQATLPAAVSSLPKMGVIFIDGGHSIETIANDWRYCSQLMDARTIVMFDDYYFDRNDVGCKQVVEQIDRKEYRVEILPRRDRFKKPWGVLSINFVKVVLKQLLADSF